MSRSCHDRSAEAVTRGIRLCHKCVKSRASEVWIRREAFTLYGMRARLLGLLAVAACALTAGAAHPAGARAASGIQFGLTDDAWLTDGPGTLDARLDKLQAIGVKVGRHPLART